MSTGETPKRVSSRSSVRSVRTIASPAPMIPAKLPPSNNPIVNMDRFISRLTIILSTPSGTDSLLRTITYTLQFVVCGLQSIMINHMDKIMNLVITINRFLPKKSKSKSKPKPSTNTGIARKRSKPLSAQIIPIIAQTMPRAKKLSVLISDFRTFTRVWGLLGLYAWAKSLVMTPPKDRVLYAIAWGQCLAYTAYQGFENRAFLAGKGIWKKRDGKDIVSDWLWSSRMWMVGVGLEFLRLMRVRQTWKSRVMSAEEKQKENSMWWREFIANCANAPLTVHWSIDGGKLDDTTVGFLGMIGGYVGLKERWRVAGEAIRL